MEEYSDRTPADIARYPMVPIRDVVIFPFTKVAFKIGRPGSVRALEKALASDRTIFLSTQHDATVDEPNPDQIYLVGTIARILQSQRQENGQIKVVVEGRERATTIRVENDGGAFTAMVRRAPSGRWKRLRRSITSTSKSKLFTKSWVAKMSAPNSTS